MSPINQEIKVAAQMMENARQADDKDDYEYWSNTHSYLVTLRGLGLNYIEIPTGVDNG